MRRPKLMTDVEESIGSSSPDIRLNAHDIAAHKLIAIPFVESLIRDTSTLGRMSSSCAKAAIVLMMYDKLILHYEGARDRQLAGEDAEQGQYFAHQREMFSSQEIERVFDSPGGWSDFPQVKERIEADGRKAKSGEEKSQYRLRRNLNLARLALEKEIDCQMEGCHLMAVHQQAEVLSRAAAMDLFYEVAASRETGPLLASYAEVLIDTLWPMVKPVLLEQGYLEPAVVPDHPYSF